MPPYNVPDKGESLFTCLGCSFSSEKWNSPSQPEHNFQAFSKLPDSTQKFLKGAQCSLDIQIHGHLESTGLNSAGWLTSLGPVCVWLRLVSDTFVGLNWPSGNIHTTKKGSKSGCPGPGLFCLPIARQSQPFPAGLLPPVCPENASGSSDLLDLGLGKAQMKRKILVWQLPRWPWDQRSFPWDAL